MAEVDSVPAAAGAPLLPPWSRWDRWLSAAIGALAAVALMLLFVHTAVDPEFWWDESGQYWMSLGQYHLADTGTAPGPIQDGLWRGRNGWNLDPVGFTVLLRGWIEIFGSAPVALRALPFMAYMAAFLTGAVMGRRVMRLPWFVSSALSLGVLGAALPAQYATELRAYSWELLGVLVTAWLTVAVLTGLNRRAAAALPVVYVVFAVCSRYSFVVAVAASCLALLVAAAAIRSRQLWQALAVAAGGAVVAAVIVLWNVGIFGGGRQASPGYTDRLELSGSGAGEILGDTLRANFVSGAQACVGLFLLAAVGYLTMNRIWGRAVGTAMTQRRQGAAVLRPWTGALLVVVAYESMAMIVSVLGAAPWNADYRWSIGLYAVALVAAFGLVSLALEILGALQSRMTSEAAHRLRAALYIASAVGCLLIAIGGSLRMIGFDRIDYQRLGPTLAVIPESDRVMVAADYWPSYRMLTETGTSPQSPSILLGLNPSGQQGPGQEPVMFAGDADYTATLPVDGGCVRGQTTAVLLPQPPDSLPLTIRAIRAASRSSGCLVEVRSGPDGGAVVVVRG